MTRKQLIAALMADPSVDDDAPVVVFTKVPVHIGHIDRVEVHPAAPESFPPVEKPFLVIEVGS